MLELNALYKYPSGGTVKVLYLSDASATVKFQEAPFTVLQISTESAIERINQ